MKNTIYQLLFMMSLGLVVFSCKKETSDAPEACFVVSEERKVGIPILFSTSCSLNADTYHWDFGDGNSSKEAYPSHTYSEEGDYAVTLTVENSKGDTDRVTHVVIVEAPV